MRADLEEVEEVEVAEGLQEVVEVKLQDEMAVPCPPVAHHARGRTTHSDRSSEFVLRAHTCLHGLTWIYPPCSHLPPGPTRD